MPVLLRLLARFGAIVGILLCLAPGFLRLVGQFWWASFQLGTVFMTGIAFLVISAVCYLALLVEFPDEIREDRNRP